MFFNPIDLYCIFICELLRINNFLQTIIDQADVLLKGTGMLNAWKWPEIPGLQDFKGSLIHSANWDETFKPEGKKVAVVGYGSSAMQIVPTLQPIVASMDTYVRGRTWLSPSGPGAEEIKSRGGINNCKIFPAIF